MNELMLASIIFISAALLVFAVIMTVSAFFSKEDRNVQRRMRMVATSGDNYDNLALKLLKEENDWKRYSFFSEFPPLFNLPLLFTQAGISMNIGRWLSITLLISSCVGAVGTFVTNPLIGAVAFVGVVAVMYMYILIKRNIRLGQIEESLAPALELISRSMRAGHPFTMGLEMVASEMSPPISEEISIVYQEHRMGLPMDDALQKLAVRVPILDIRFFTLVVLIHQQTGGDLAEILDNLARIIRERFKIKRQIKALTAEGRLSGWVLCILPIFVFILLFSVNRDYIMLLFTTPQGVKMLYAAVFLQILGVIFIRKIVNIKV